MTKLERIAKNVEENKDIQKSLKANEHYSTENFIKDAFQYIKAIKEGRMINSIGSVSSSGMSRTISFMSCEKSNYKGGTGYTYRQYYALFKVLGYSPKDNNGYFRIHGAGMDMIFHTNYSIIHTLRRLGFINKKQCESFAQMTPSTI